MQPIIETHNLTKQFGRFVALRGLDLRVPEGSVFSLMGPSGAGKTTAIKILLNMTPPTSGTSQILGADSRVIGPKVLDRVGYASENQALPLQLRVRSFFAYVRRCYPEWDPELEQYLRDQFRLPPDRRIGELSHGMRVKLILASALAFHPRLLVLDEPFTGLDALARDEIVIQFRRLRPKMTILISSHELDEIERLATHVAFLHEGRLLFQGTIEALRDYSRTIIGAAPTDGSLRSLFVAMMRAEVHKLAAGQIRQ